MSGVLLREAKPTDASAIAAIHLAARREAMPYLRELHGYDEVTGWVATILLPETAVWVAELAGAPVGYLALRGRSLEHLYVAPSHQGRGIGGRLLDRAKALSPEELRLYTFQRSHRARSFYEAGGFAPIAFTDGAGNEEKEPDVLYAWYGTA